MRRGGVVDVLYFIQFRNEMPAKTYKQMQQFESKICDALGFLTMKKKKKNE